MIGTVVVPLDGSELGERALVYAKGIADRSGAPILLLRVARVGADEPELTESREYLRRVAAQLPGRVQIEVERGRAADKIVELAHQSGNPLIVMSTHGRGGLHRWMTGSVADKVVRLAETPVLLVRSNQELPDELTIRSILVPVDGSEWGEVAVDYAAELSKLFECELHLLRVVDTPSAYAMLSRHMEVAASGDVLDEIIQSMNDEAKEYLKQLETRLSEKGVRVKKETLEGYPGERLVEFERQGYFQLVVMATAGRSGVSRVVFGSVAERMLKMGRCPVVMIRPPHESP